MSGGARVAGILRERGLRFLFTLCGGHISPILVECARQGLRVVDTRSEASAVFAADACARLTGLPGVAAVTAGPGVANTVTAVQNARMAGTPLVILGGATATLLQGRGALQDIDQVGLMRPLVKWLAASRRVRDLAEAVREALHRAEEDPPGPVFVECPVDLLYDEAVVRDWYRQGAGRNPLVRFVLARHLRRLFAGAGRALPPLPPGVPAGEAPRRLLERLASALAKAARPVLVVGQALARPGEAAEVAAAIRGLGLPTFLSGAARGLLGRDDPLQFRHRRKGALREADLVLLAGVPQDFRLGYGRHVNPRAFLAAVNRSREQLLLNRRPTLGHVGDPATFLRDLAGLVAHLPARREAWFARLRREEEEREAEIDREAALPTEFVNPVRLCREIERALPENALLVVDGGDFVATASYVVRPRGPLGWLDPGPFGTLGVGGGFAAAAALCRPGDEVWLLYGDGSAGYSLAEFDTFARHGLPVIAVIGNDGSWAQIARDQEEVLGDPVGTVLRRSDYHRVAEGYGGVGLLLERPEDTVEVLARARQEARSGRPVLVNARIGRTGFRKGSISL